MRGDELILGLSQIQSAAGITGLYSSLGDMLKDDIPPQEEILFGLARGNVAQLVGTTNAGKTTLILNVCLRLAAGESCWPLAPSVPQPRRILYIDFEATKPELVKHILAMKQNFSDDSWALIEQNFIPFPDPLLGDEPLDLSNSSHLNLVINIAKDLRVDLIIIDTVSAAFDIQNENDNAEIKRTVMKPLKRLARLTNAVVIENELDASAAVLFTHHSGKPNETMTGEAAYSGRGASAFGGLSRAVFQIVPDRIKGDGFIQLRCAKAKRPKFEPVLLRLDQERAWFDVCEDRPSSEQPLTMNELVAFVTNKGGDVDNKTIHAEFAKRASKKTIDRRKAQAIEAGLIEETGKGKYRIKRKLELAG